MAENCKDKIHISIYGCCVSREIFNYYPCKDIFDIDSYIWQISPHTIFDEGIDFPEEEIDKLLTSSYEKRMIKNEFNKGTIKEFTERNRGGYFLLIY